MAFKIALTSQHRIKTSKNRKREEKKCEMMRIVQRACETRTFSQADKRFSTQFAVGIAKFIELLGRHIYDDHELYDWGFILFAIHYAINIKEVVGKLSYTELNTISAEMKQFSINQSINQSIDKSINQ